jgi:hypothetical protein
VPWSSSRSESTSTVTTSRTPSSMTATQSFDDPDVVVDDADMLDDEAE